MKYFDDWLTHHHDDQYLCDIRWLTVLIEAVLDRENELDPEVRLEMTEKLVEKVIQRQRYFHRDGWPKYWDRRNMRPVMKIRDRLIAAGAIPE